MTNALNGRYKHFEMTVYLNYLINTNREFDSLHCKHTTCTDSIWTGKYENLHSSCYVLHEKLFALKHKSNIPVQRLSYFESSNCDITLFETI